MWVFHVTLQLEQRELISVFCFKTHLSSLISELATKMCEQKNTEICSGTNTSFLLIRTNDKHSYSFFKGQETLQMWHLLDLNSLELNHEETKCEHCQILALKVNYEDSLNT